MKKQIRRIVALALMAVLCLGLFAGCSSSNSAAKGSVKINFMYGGNTTMNKMLYAMAEQFNNTVGAEQKIVVNAVPKTGDLSSILAQQLPSTSGPDVVVLSDEYFKMYTKYLEDLNSYLEGDTLDSYYPTISQRYRYDLQTNTSNSDDPTYGIPVYNDTTMLYYNKTAFEHVGVICISVAEEDLEAFNNGATDANGKTKADYGITIDVPAKGYYRSENPYIPAAGETDGSSWKMPSSTEVLIFNDKIAMNWDEIEDLAMLCTKSINSDSKTVYGYYTEWWFNYGWSVGGNCVEDLSGEGDWVYSLQSGLANYVVNEGKTYTGIYTGTVYQGGDTLDIKDVVDAAKGDTIGYETDDKTYYSYTVNGTVTGARDFSAEIADGTLTELPSTKTAFSRFAYLAGVGGINVCPYPSAMNGSSSPQYFAAGRLAMLVERTSYYADIEKILIDSEWGIAPLPIYKVYEEPTNANCDTVAAAGVNATHSLGYCLSMSSKSQAKDEAAVFIEWMASEGQQWLAENGYVSSRTSDFDTCVENLTYRNPSVVMSCASVAQAGDWWYMPDRSWIDAWAVPLNNKVRYGLMPLDEFMYAYVTESNNRLAEYKQ